MILGQDSKKLEKFLGQWNGKTETDSQTGQAIYKPDNKSQGPIHTFQTVLGQTHLGTQSLFSDIL